MMGFIFQNIVGITAFDYLVNYIQFWHDLGVTWENSTYIINSY